MRGFRRVLSSAVLVLLLVLPSVILWQRQNIADWWRLRDYDPHPEVAALAERTAMTPKGRKLFFVHYPELNDRSSFNGYCKAVEHTIVLGCYISRQSIHIFDVEDERLEGIKEVTAAHEMLHAAYDRLSDKERTRVDGLTESAFQALQDERLRKVVDTYRERDGSIVANELHSILATEVRELPSELEEYYSLYFTDRSKVVALSEQYEQVFTQQRQHLEEVQADIERIENQLGAERRFIDDMERNIIVESDRLSSLRAQNQIEEYNAAVPAYNSSIRQYRDRIDTYNGQVRVLNGLIEEYNQTAVQQKELFDAINSTAPAV